MTPERRIYLQALRDSLAEYAAAGESGFSDGGISACGLIWDMIKQLNPVVDLLIKDGVEFAKARAHISKSGDGLQRGGFGLDAAGVIAKLIEAKVTAPAPTVFSRFRWITDPKFQSLLDSDFAEAQACLADGRYKACVILCGSILEAALYELLRRDVAWTMNRARASLPHRMKGRIPDIGSDEVDESWKLVELIKFSEDNRILKKEITKRIDVALRDSRNLIHPTAHLRSGLADAANLAKISAAALNIALDAISVARVPP